jgi:DNA primase large subunit
MAVRGSPSVGERERNTEYPFLPGAERLVAELSPSLAELIDDPAFARARELGRARVRAAADDPTGASGLDEALRATPEERFLSFAYARLLLAAAPTPAARRRWAVWEAKRSHARLRSAPLDELLAVARALGYRFEPDGDRIRLPLVDYLALATPVREAEFRLGRQPVAQGRVYLRRERAARLLQEGVRLRLTEPVSLGDDVRVRLSEAEAEFFRDLSARMPQPATRAGSGPGALRPERFPPCIRKMRRMLHDGENLSHSGRFALAAFLHRVGADFETIVDAYRGAPDFDEGITRYQVEHITSREDGRGYEPPECETLRSHGLCFRDGDPSAPSPTDRGRDDLCFEPRLRHPLQYYRITAERAGAPSRSGSRAPAPPSRGEGEGRDFRRSSGP